MSPQNSQPCDTQPVAERVRRILDRRKPRRILFVDDDAAVVLFARSVLSDAGYEVLVGADGNVALSAAKAEHPDLAIIDLMPEREGLATIMTLRKLHPSLPVIATSGAFGGYFLKAATTLGAHATLPKPFGREELVEAVRVVLGTSAGRACNIGAPNETCEDLLNQFDNLEST